MVYCLHRLHLLYLYFKNYRPEEKKPAPLPVLPFVTIQLPVYNEMYVIKRLLNAVALLDYPKEFFEIQVLDDSTDETSRIALQHCNILQSQGFQVTYLHRTDRIGFKAGALEKGLKIARGDFIAVFDADFVPEKGFLRQTISYFDDPKIGMVQTRWSHINRSYSKLTQLQSIFLDAHFILEHTARNRSGRFFNFNGTAGVWRKSCIVSAGGWEHHTLTEDLDLSYRAQLKGWQFVFLPEILSPGEIPVDMNSFKSQQHRWAKGGIETGRKILPILFKSPLPLSVKIESFFHLTANANYLLILALSLLMYPALVVRIQMGWKSLFILDLLCFILSVVPISLFYLVSQHRARQSLRSLFIHIPLLMSLGIGLSINNGKAVLEALFGHKTAFIRTPKFNITSRSDSWKQKKYRAILYYRQVMIELFFALYSLSAIIFAVLFSVYTSLPFLLLFFCGFSYVSYLSIQQQLRKPLTGE